MKNKLLWQKEEDFKESLERAKNIAMYNKITIKELLDLGFNNNYLELDDESIELGFVDYEGDYNTSLNKEQLNVKVYMKEDFGWYSDEDIDNDGYHIARVYLLNKDDEKLFKKEVE